MATKANELDILPAVLSSQIVVLADSAGKLYQTTVGALLAAAIPPDLSLKADLVSGKVPSYQLPSYVDDVLEFATLSALPAEGETGKLYVITTGVDSGKLYRWTGTIYVQVGGTGDGSDVTAEAAARVAGDNNLQSEIDAEAANRAAAETTLQNNITTETNARINADTTLQTNINNEATARANADTTLQNNINSETNARVNADSAEANARAAADALLVPKATILTINGLSQDLSADRTWSTGTEDELITGGKVTWSGTGLTFNVTAAVYKINGVQYSSAAGSITLSASDVVNDRLDVIALDNTGAIIKVSGIAASAPEIPQIDASTQLYLTAVLVQTNATIPSGISQTIIYDENTEWTPSSVNLTANFNNATNPFTGSKAIDITAASNGGYLLFTNASALNSVNFSVLKFYIRLKAVLAATSNINVSFFNGAAQVSNAVNLISTYGFVKGTINTYQNITINMSAFTFTNSTFTRVRITFTGSPFSAFYIDYVQLQGGITTGYPSLIWGNITGTLSNQADLQAALNLKAGNAALTAETNNRTNADITLQSNINNEATARANADTTLQNNIDLKLNIADYNDRFKGKYTTLAALQAAHPTSNSGDYAQVDAGAGSNVKNYNYDVDDGWIEGGSGSAATDTDGLPEGATNLYFTSERAIAAVDLSGKVDKITGKGLSTEDYTTAEKTKLAGIAAGAQVNDASTTLQGNTFNGANQLVKLDGTAKLPAIDGSQLTGLPAGGAVIDDVTPSTSKVYSSSKIEGKFLDQSGAKISAIASGTDTYTATISPAISAYQSTQRFYIKFTNANTGAATLNLNALGAKSIKKGVSTALGAGDIAAGQIICIAYDGTNFQIIGSGWPTAADVTTINQKILSIAGNYSQSIL